MAIKLDETDLHLLSLLEKDSKARMHVLGRRLSLPASTVHHRVKRLESEGIIRSYGISKDYSAMGIKLKAYIMVFVDVTALKRMKKSQVELAREMRKIGNVQSVAVMFFHTAVPATFLVQQKRLTKGLPVLTATSSAGVASDPGVHETRPVFGSIFIPAGAASSE